MSEKVEGIRNIALVAHGGRRQNLPGRSHAFRRRRDQPHGAHRRRQHGAGFRARGDQAHVKHQHRLSSGELEKTRRHPDGHPGRPELLLRHQDLPAGRRRRRGRHRCRGRRQGPDRDGLGIPGRLQAAAGDLHQQAGPRARRFHAGPSKKPRSMFQPKPIILQLPIGAEADFKGVVDLITQKAYVYGEDGKGQGVRDPGGHEGCGRGRARGPDREHRRSRRRPGRTLPRRRNPFRRGPQGRPAQGHPGADLHPRALRLGRPPTSASTCFMDFIAAAMPSPLDAGPRVGKDPATRQGDRARRPTPPRPSRRWSSRPSPTPMPAGSPFSGSSPGPSAATAPSTTRRRKCASATTSCW
ncbi:MAG: hypothetical protein MZV70_67855 [Desulfobacterales bacterium]|nr:hypothetical protein [Desulfobacterales bacterium]